MTRSTNMELVEVLERLRNRWAMPGEHAALDAAIVALSAPQPPAEAQPVAWDVFDKEGNLIAGRVSKADADEIASRWEYEGSRISPLYAHPPPSVPVGVEGVLRDALQGLIDFIEIDSLPMDADALFIAKRALAQQPASDGGFTAADMMDARQEGRKEAEARADRLADALRWYVENDDTNEGQEGNEYWLAGRDRAIAVLQEVGNE